MDHFSKWTSVVFLAVISTFVSCGVQNKNSLSRHKDLAADPHAKNIAVIIGAPSSGQNYLGGVGKDIVEIKELFSKPELGFQVLVKNFATRADMEAVAREVSGQLEENSTLIWYYSGHGLESGKLFAQDETLVDFRTLVAEMGKVRKNKFKRLLVVLDSCFSGQNVDGSLAFIPSEGQPAASAAFADKLGSSISPVGYSLDGEELPFEQALVFAAARSNETSADAGATVGGLFSATWKMVMVDLFKDPTKTIGDMIAITAKATYQNASAGGRKGHTPVYRALPVSILKEPLLSNTSTPVTAPPITNVSAVEAYMALIGSDEINPFMQISLPSSLNVAFAFLCKGSEVECQNSTTTLKLEEFAISNDTKISGRSIFESKRALTLETAEYSAIFKNSAGQVVGFKKIKLTQHL